ncbi:MAG: sigma-70 family RNA polymerase sigma factor [Mogibacterium sp.]|nr:sigma-70 family RNA polymerase sigma factor [Mogibacterium sp.]MBR4091509.1 sigma-70 family RNA polymerase sigma factor [Mogibacterium sp.]
MMDIEKLYREYFTPVYRYTLSLVHDPDMAEEITQETFFRALKKINDYRGEASLKVWLCQIARNLSFDSLKRQSKTLALTKHDDDESDDYELPAGSESDPEEQLLRKQTAMKIHRILHDLKEPYKEVFQLRTFGDLSFAEIGELFGKSESWARVTYYRSRMMIKEELDEDSL